jgi:hypothetical protein
MRIRDPRWKEFRSEINILDTQHCFFVMFIYCLGRFSSYSMTIAHAHYSVDQKSAWMKHCTRTAGGASTSDNSCRWSRLVTASCSRAWATPSMPISTAATSMRVAPQRSPRIITSKVRNYLFILFCWLRHIIHGFRIQIYTQWRTQGGCTGSPTPPPPHPVKSWVRPCLYPYPAKICDWKIMSICLPDLQMFLTDPQIRKSN